MVKPLAETRDVVKASKRKRGKAAIATVDAEVAAEPRTVSHTEGATTITTTTTTRTVEEGAEPAPWNGDVAGSQAVPGTRDADTAVELEGFGGGGTSKIKRITWEGEAPHEESHVERHVVEREWRPRHPTTINQIHWEIDRFGGSYLPSRNRRSVLETIRSRDVRSQDVVGLAAKRVGAHRCTECGSFHTHGHGHDEGSGTFYQTKRGAVDRVRRAGRASTYYVRDRNTVEPRRFTPKLVDDIIRAKAPAALDEDVVVETTKTVTKTDAEGVAVTTTTKTVRREGDGPIPDEIEGRPVCAAHTKAGDACQNKSRAGSKYCASHKGYHPKANE